MSCYINAISYHLPSDTLTNAEISKQYPEWTIEKISEKVGINTRHICGETETAGDLAYFAAESLFSKNPSARDSVDFIILCTQSPDYFLPSTACILQNRLGLKADCGAFDFNLGCSGYVYGLGLAKALIISRQATTVLLLTGETYTKYISDNDKGNKTIFGDAGTATLISENASGLKLSIGDFCYGTDGRGANHLIVKNGGARHPILDGVDNFDKSGNFQSNDNHLFMNGKEIFDFTFFEVPKLIKKTLEKNHVTSEAIDLFIFHQANKFMLLNMRKRCRIPEEKFFVGMEDTGNTVSNSIPIAICRAYHSKRLCSAKKILLSGFGVGLSMAAVVLKTNGSIPSVSHD